MMKKMTENDFLEIWKPVKSVIEHCNLDYGEAVTLGSQFGKLKEIIFKIQEEIESLQDDSNKLSALEAGGVDNWSGYSDALMMYYNDEEEEE